ncbi:MAG: YbaN family protein [Euryarchaeota archaeon]|nr:YbaN family protein [Euryarchaeota archaeon]
MREPEGAPRPSRLPRWAWTTLGHLSVGAGALGLIVPGLPTTPLILLAASCYARGSDRFHRWLLDHRVFGPMVRNWHEHRAISLRAKVTAIAILWLVLVSTIHFFAPFLWVKVVLGAIGLGVTAFLLSVRTRATEPLHQPQARTDTSGLETESSR